MSLTVVTIAKNEADSIQRCIRAAKQVAEEHIVVDSDSTDNTVALAKVEGAIITHHAWLGYGPQKNIGLEAAHSEWVLFIDADEEVTSDLAKEILTVTSEVKVDFIWLRIVTVFLGKPLRHLYGHNPRLFKKTAGHWSNDAVHEQVETNSGERIKLGDKHSYVLNHSLLHHSHPTIKSYLHKMHRYTSLDAEQMKLTGKHRSGKPISASWLLPWRLSIRQFIKLLIYRGGWLDGWAGLVWCALSGYYEYEMARKYLRLLRSN